MSPYGLGAQSRCLPGTLSDVISMVTHRKRKMVPLMEKKRRIRMNLKKKMSHGLVSLYVNEQMGRQHNIIHIVRIVIATKTSLGSSSGANNEACCPPKLLCCAAQTRYIHPAARKAKRLRFQPVLVEGIARAAQKSVAAINDRAKEKEKREVAFIALSSREQTGQTSSAQPV
jgi:hypothetical protein